MAVYRQASERMAKAAALCPEGPESDAPDMGGFRKAQPERLWLFRICRGFTWIYSVIWGLQ